MLTASPATFSASRALPFSERPKCAEARISPAWATPSMSENLRLMAMASSAAFLALHCWFCWAWRPASFSQAAASRFRSPAAWKRAGTPFIVVRAPLISFIRTWRATISISAAPSPLLLPAALKPFMKAMDVSNACCRALACTWIPTRTSMQPIIPSKPCGPRSRKIVLAASACRCASPRSFCWSLALAFSNNASASPFLSAMPLKREIASAEGPKAWAGEFSSRWSCAILNMTAASFALSPRCLASSASCCTMKTASSFSPRLRCALTTMSSGSSVGRPSSWNFARASLATCKPVS
mmetsp:Transcript_67722/g.218802  ORF Transcript_67722/g.218802 Transcript_67722/m.218802 type:complete len:297 (+) Transcript_67722:963-1853(+)